MRAICYQRFSTDKQSDRTIADQRRECHEFAEAQGWTVVADYADEGISGAKLSRRPGMQALLAHAEAGGVDIVTAVDLSRVSRSLAHTAGIFDRLAFRGIKIWTRADGLIDETQLGMLGTFGAMTRKMAATRTRDALRSLARDGFSVGGRTYGFRSVKDGDHSRPVIEEAEAEVIRTIYRQFADGESPRQIAAGLNAEGIKSPTGGTWRPSTIAGNRLRGTGILANRTYVGERRYGEREWRLDPQSERRRPARFGDRDRRPEKDWIKRDDAKLRIIDDALWNRVQARLEEIENHTAAIRKKHGSVKARGGRHAVHLLSGILRCGTCGGPMSLVNASKYGCADAFDKRTCQNRSYLRRDIAEAKIIETIRFEMCSADGLRHAAQRIRAAVETRLKKAGGESAANVKRLAKVEKGLANIAKAVAAGFDPADLKAEADKLKAQKADLEASLQIVRIDPAQVAEAVNAALTNYQRTMRDLMATGLSARSTEAKRAIAELVGGRIDIVPRDDGGLDAVLHGDYMAAIRIAKTGSRKNNRAGVPHGLTAEGAAISRIARGHAGPTVSHVW